MMNWSERGSIRKRGPLWEPFCKNSALAADRRTNHGSEKEETLRRPMEALEETERNTI